MPVNVPRWYYISQLTKLLLQRHLFFMCGVALVFFVLATVPQVTHLYSQVPLDRTTRWLFLTLLAAVAYLYLATLW